jgi:hypothetical protein
LRNGVGRVLRDRDGAHQCRARRLHRSPPRPAGVPPRVCSRLRCHAHDPPPSHEVGESGPRESASIETVLTGYRLTDSSKAHSSELGRTIMVWIVSFPAHKESRCAASVMDS